MIIGNTQRALAAAKAARVPESSKSVGDRNDGHAVSRACDRGSRLQQGQVAILVDAENRQISQRAATGNRRDPSAI